MDNKQFQWIKGNLIGEVEVITGDKIEDNVKFIVFESGRRVAANRLYEYLAPVENAYQIIDSNTLKAAFDRDSNSYYDVDSKYEEIVFGTTTTKKKKPQKKIEETEEQDSSYSNSITVMDLVEKQLEKNPHIMEVEIKIPTLKKEHYQMLYDMYPDIKEDLLKLIISKYIDKAYLSEQIGKCLSVFYGDLILSSVIELNAEQI